MRAREGEAKSKRIREKMASVRASVHVGACTVSIREGELGPLVFEKEASKLTQEE